MASYSLVSSNMQVGDSLYLTLQVNADWNGYYLSTPTITKITDMMFDGSGDMWSDALSVKFLLSIDVYEFEYNLYSAMQVLWFDDTLTIIDIPDTITKLADDMFGQALNIKTFIANGLTEVQQSHVPGRVEELILKNVKTVGDKLLYDYSKQCWLKKVDIPNCEYIGDRAFCGCNVLTSINIPLVKTIGVAAFSGCTKLNIIDGLNATSIGSSAFYADDPYSYEHLLVTQVTGDSLIINSYDWLSNNRQVGTIVKKYKYSLKCQNHSDGFFVIDLEKYSDGQIKLLVDDSKKSVRLQEGTTDKNQSPICVVVDGKCYQLKY